MHVRQERGELIQIKGATSKDRRDFRNKSATEGVDNIWYLWLVIGGMVAFMLTLGAVALANGDKR
jgi:hypothetical protein